MKRMDPISTKPLCPACAFAQIEHAGCDAAADLIFCTNSGNKIELVQRSIYGCAYYMKARKEEEHETD